jgi:hypothetical protein
MRWRFRVGAAALWTIGRLPMGRRRLATTTSLQKAALSLTAADREKYVSNLVHADPRILRQIAITTAAATPPANREHLGRCMAIAGTRDPQMSAAQFRQSIASVGLVPGNIRVIQSATHFPFLDNRFRPEDTSRNVAEIVDSIGEMLIAAKDGTRLLPPEEPGSTTWPDLSDVSD